MKNAELEELNRIHYEVTADQNLKIQDLKALNAELLERLKASQQTISRVLSEERQVITDSKYAHEHEIRLRYLEVVTENNSVVIAKAEGKQIKSL